MTTENEKNEAVIITGEAANRIREREKREEVMVRIERRKAKADQELQDQLEELEEMLVELNILGKYVMRP